MSAGHIASLPGSLALLPAYYYLYALYHDYPLNNAFLARQEYAAHMADFARHVQTVAALEQPYRKSFALRLFTGRESLARFSPHQVAEALRELRELLRRSPPPPGPRRALPPPDWSARRDAPRRRRPPQGRPARTFPRSPVDYRLIA